MPEAEPSAALRSQVGALVRDELGYGGELTGATNLAADLLVDSLAKVELAMVIEDALSIGITDRALADVRTFGDLCDAAAAAARFRR